MLRNKVSRVAVVCGGALASGCVGWYSAPAAPTTQEPPAAKSTPLAVECNLHVFFGETELDRTQVSNAEAKVRTSFAEAFQDSKRYDVSSTAAEYQLKVDITDRGDPNIVLAVLSGLTLTVLPAWASDNYTTEVHLLDKSGKELGSTSYEHSSSVLIQLLLFPAMPFAFPSSKEEAMWNDVTANTVAWVDAELAKAGPTPRSTLAQTGG